MTTFKEISGQLIRTLSSDPANPLEGQIWYNSTIGVLKGYKSIGAAWSSSSPTINAKFNRGTAGTQTEGLVAGGQPATSATEEYNGVGWSAGGNLNTARDQLGGFGIQTAAVVFGGNVPPYTSATELYNGTSWTNNPTGLNVARQSYTGCGLQTAGLAFGGIALQI